MPHSLLKRVLAGVALLLGPAMVGFADDEISNSQVRQLLRKHCYACHAVEPAEGELRLDQLSLDFADALDSERWQSVRERLELGDMPPEDEQPALAESDRRLLIAWIAQARRKAELAKPQPPTFRRLTRREYERTMQDLLDLPIEFGARLPEDGKSRYGFRNDGDVLRMSPLQYELFLQIADEALGEAIVTGPPPVVHRYRITVHDFKVEPLPKPAERPGESFDYTSDPFEVINIATIPRRRPGSRRRPKPPPNPYPPNILVPDEIVRFREAAVREPKRSVTLRIHQAFRSGETLIKVRAARIEPETGSPSVRPPVLTVAVGSTNFHGLELRTIGEPIVVNDTELREYEFRCRMENVSVPNVGPLNRRNATILSAWNSAQIIEDETQPPLLHIESIEFETPYLESWPPATHTAILFANPGLAEPDYAREVLQRFARKAYRGPLTAEELDRLVAFWTRTRETSESLEDSFRETLAVVLSSPRFLGLVASREREQPESLTDHELASRLSYFLWGTMPDEALIQSADEHRLHQPAELSSQVERMIQDPKARFFIEQFTEQWLELDRLQRVVVHRESYPDYNDRLAEAMRRETLHFFGEVLRGNGSIFELLDSDYTCVNDILASHYGIEGINDPIFRKVELNDDLHRGGILTQASVLTGLSDGRDGHPIKRGVWLLRNLLDDPPPPPPPNVPELNREEPELQGLTIPQALELHRNSASCMGCHRQIDPWGIAFEEYDAVGNWQRDGQGAKLREQRTSLPVESSTELPGGTTVTGMDSLKRVLIDAHSDDFRRTLIRKVMAYALGRQLSVRDQDVAENLVATLRARQDRLSALIELIVASEPFQSK